jgi:hypothetical protein
MGIGDTMQTTDTIMKLIQDFASQLVAATQAATEDRLRASFAGSFSPSGKRGPGRQAKVASTTATPTAGRRPMTITPKVTRARKLQGQYLGTLRSLGAGDKAKVKAVAKEQGVAAAVKLALSLKAKK